MNIESKEVPQADNLEDVIKTVFSIAEGARTDKDIATILRKDPRQGRYYRNAAEILGFIVNEHNNAELTSEGKKFVSASKGEREKILLDVVLRIPVFQRLVSILEVEKEVPRKKLERIFGEISGLGKKSMAERRLATPLSWMRRLGLIDGKEKDIFLKKIPESAEVLSFRDEEPLLPKNFTLKDYKETAARKGKTGDYTMVVSEAKRERANVKHQSLTNIVAKRIKDAGSIPKNNLYVDLATKHDDLNYIFEMKSSTEENIHSQVRKGISQLYEYKYLQNISSAELVLVVEEKPTNGNAWLIDYLIGERNISIIWDGHDDQLFCPKALKNKLGFLKPNFV